MGQVKNTIFRPIIHHARFQIFSQNTESILGEKNFFPREHFENRMGRPVWFELEEINIIITHAD
jgi:hypothetical protein